MSRLLMVLMLAGATAGCGTNYATSSAPVGPDEDVYFECHASAAYVRRHTDVCSGILK